MQITVNKSDLVRELGLSQGVVEKKSTIPILANVLLEATGGRLVLTATDLELGFRCSCPAEVIQEGAGTLPVKRFLDYVRLLPDVGVTIKFQDNHWAAISCGRSRTRIAGMGRESYPELPEMPPVQARIPAKRLAAMIHKTVFAIAVEESRFALNGGLLLLQKDRMLMVSTDGHRLSMVQFHETPDFLAAHQKAIVPRKALTELLRLAENVAPEAHVEFAGSDNHLFFRFHDHLLICRRLSGNFPDFERVLPKEFPNPVLLQNSELRATLERVAQFADEHTKSVRLLLSDGELKVFSSISETGESEEVIPVDYAGKSINVGFNAGYFLDFLRASPEEQVLLSIKDAESAGELRPVTQDDAYQYRYVVMPMRI